MTRNLTTLTRRTTLTFLLLIAVLVISSELMFDWVRSSERDAGELFSHAGTLIEPLRDIEFMRVQLAGASGPVADALIEVINREGARLQQSVLVADSLPTTSDFRAMFFDPELQLQDRLAATIAAIGQLTQTSAGLTDAIDPSLTAIEQVVPALLTDLEAYLEGQRAEFAQVSLFQQAINLLRIAVIVLAIVGYAALIHFPLLDRLGAQTASLAEQVEQATRSEHDLRAQKSMFESVLRTTPGLVFVYDIPADALAFSSQPIWAFFGFQEDTWNTLNDTSTFNFVVEDDRWLVLAALRRLVDGEDEVSFEARTSDGAGRLRWFQTRIVPFRKEDGTLTQIVGTVTEFTELKLAQAEREKQARLLTQITVAAPELIYLMETRSKRKLYQNIDVRELLGYPRDVWHKYDPDPYDFLIHPADRDRAVEHFAQLFKLADDDVLELEFRMLDANGRWRTMLSSDKVFERDERGNVLAHVGVCHDISEWRETEKRAFELRLERERMRVNAEFIANSSHELRTPLTIISSTAYVMSRSDDPLVRSSRLTDIEHQIVRLSKLVDDLQTLASLDAGPMHALTEVDVNAALRDAIDLTHADEQAAPPAVTLDSSLPSVAGDRHLLTQGFRHVIQNARMYSPPDQPIEVASRVVGPCVVVTVTDHGPGIDPNDIPHIFNRFYKADKARSSGGTGLGLAMVKKIMETHDGTVYVESSAEGSTFTLTLPIQSERNSARPRPQSVDRFS